MEKLTLLDTSVLFDFFGGHGKTSEVELLLSKERAALSVVTVYELFRGVENKKHLDHREHLVSLCRVLDVTKPIARKAAEIYTHLKKSGNLIPNEDILIGATALHWKYPLLTQNEKDFRRIPHLILA